MNSRDFDVLKKIVQYCEEIIEARVRLGDSYESLESDALFRNATSMCILQIGELTTHLSEEFKAEFNEMPWQDIKGMRNVAAHHYGKFDVKKLWETITADVPELMKYCVELIKTEIM